MNFNGRDLNGTSAMKYCVKLAGQISPGSINWMEECKLGEKRQINYFIRVLIVLFIVFLGYLVLTSFTKSQPPFSISTGIITLLLLITILILSEAFDNFSVGKLLSISREIKKKEEEVGKVKKENAELRDNIIQVTTMFGQIQAQSNSNTNVVLAPEWISQMLGVVKAQQKQEDEELEEFGEETTSKTTESEVKIETETNTNFNTNGTQVPNPEDNDQQKYLDRKRERLLWRYLESEAISKYIKKHDIPETEIVREVQFSPAIMGLDPIMERRIVFDGYLKTPSKETFIEVRRNMSHSIMMLDRIYVLLTKIWIYRHAKKTQAELILLIVEVPHLDEQNPTVHRLKNGTERFLEAFQPAIANGVLRVETIIFTEEELVNFDEDPSQTTLF